MFELDKKAFGTFLAALRKEKGMTQKELAQKLFLSDKAVSKWERGASLPDISLLLPLAELLGVTVSELLECRRVEHSEVRNAGEVEALLQKAIHLSEPESPATGRGRNLALMGLCLAVSLAEGLVLLSLGWSISQLADALLTPQLLAAIFGLYACLFMQERLPTYYDENKLSYYCSGIFRIHMAGVSFNNRNWPHIVQAIRRWAMVMLVAYPLCYGILSQFFPVFWHIGRLFFMLAATLGGLLVPLYWAAKKYE
ncbi:MAG: helix-turn-helix transcriptional regulator [Oscillospiraceae bacterium]|nr:helix-turn-helix transcriptional regulator [Oscillospiraceae bacterium]